jgi:succinate-acetate transporter protein
MSSTGADISKHEKGTLGESQAQHHEYSTTAPAVSHHHHHHQNGHHGPFAMADGGSLHPGLWKPYEHRKFANPAPLGLSAFALTTFVLSCVNLHTRGVSVPNIAIPLAFGYGGLVQLLAGMWEMAVGNTFGATALSSYGGFWIAYAILLSPAWGITNTETGPYSATPDDVSSVLGFFLTGWFIFTTLLLLCTLRSTVMFFMLFFTLDLAFLCLACENYAANNGALDAKLALQKAGGVFGMLAAFLAWYNALAGIQDDSNSFFQVPVFPRPWSAKALADRRAKTDRETA